MTAPEVGVFQQFPDHVHEMVPVGGVVAGGPQTGGEEAPFVIGVIGIPLEFDVHPVPVLEKLFVAEMAVEIYAEGDPLPAAGLSDGADHVEFQRGVPFPVTGVVIGVALIAPCVPSEKIHFAGFQLIGEGFRIEICSHIRDVRRGVKIVKESVIRLEHAFPLPSGDELKSFPGKKRRERPASLRKGSVPMRKKRQRPTI